MRDLTARHEDLKTFAKILRRQHVRKHDMVVGSDDLRMNDDATFRIRNAPLPDELVDTLHELGVDTSGENRADLPYNALNLAHAHVVRKHLPIPAFKRGYDFMREDNPEMLSDIVNHYLDDISKNLFVRTLRPVDEDGGRGLMRAVLSDRYEVIDNYDILVRAARTLRDMNIRPHVQCNLSTRNMWVQFTMPGRKMRADDFVADYQNPHPDGEAPGNGHVNPDDVTSRHVYPGFLLRNSEVGAGAFEIRPRLMVQVCSNGITRKQDALRKVHVGSQMDSGVVKFSEEVRQKAMALTDQQVKEAVEYFTTDEYMMDVIEDIMDKGADETLDNPREAVSNSADALDMTEEEESELFSFFMRGGSEKRAAIPQSVTAMAQHKEDPDRAYELESEAWGLLDDMDELDRPFDADDR